MSWYYVQDGASVGPLPRATVDALIRAGTIVPTSLVSPGYGDWVPAGASELAPMFGTQPLTPPVSPPPNERWKFGRADWLPKEPKSRRAVQIAVGVLGLFAVVSGVQQMQGGMEQLSGDTSVAFLGCTGVSAAAVQCGFQNMAQADRTICLDVVVLCDDGRHVASTCSDPIQPGASSTKLVDNFEPMIDATRTCANISYENQTTKGS